MKWCECFSKADMPDMREISGFVDCGLWDELCSHLEKNYAVSPKICYSSCSGAPGWNVKYQKSGRALCTLYPDEGFFTCLVSVGGREAQAAELLMSDFTETVRNLYLSAKPYNGGRWLMIPVTSPEILNDVKQLVALRVKKQKKKTD